MRIEIDNAAQAFVALKLEENSLYKVVVKTKSDKPAHTSFLFTGLKDGSDSRVYNNTYETPIPFGDINYIKVVKKLSGTVDLADKEPKKS